MGCSFIWVCDARKEYINPYPLCDSHLFTFCRFGDWRDEQVRLINDCGGSNWEYYERTHRDAAEAIACGDSPDRIYKDVTDEARKLHTEMYPDLLSDYWKQNYTQPKEFDPCPKK